MRFFVSSLVLACGLVAISAAGLEERVPASPSPVVVELFTSQGCSSCPPADRILGRLATEPGVIPLAYHVDYWNHGGWYDPFSQARWTARQAAYVRMFGLDSAYTPQAVVDGRVQLVGSRERDLRSAIAAFASRAAATVDLHLRPSARGATVEGNVERPETLRGRKLEVMVAIFETGLVTSVGGGENRGATLQDENVVRSLERAAKFAPGGASRTPFSVDIRFDSKWNRANLGVATFLQDPSTLEIVGAASARVSSAGGASGSGQ